MKRGKVLIVDDDSRNVDILVHLLEEIAELTTAANGEDAIKHCGAVNFDLVLLDIMMPGLDGYETCVSIKRLRPTTKVILVSAKAMLDERLKGYSVGADDYIAKPFDHDEFIAKVGVILKLRSTEEALVALNAQLEEMVRSRTEQLQRAEREAVAARNHVDNIIRSMPDPLLEVDSELRVRRTNAAAESLFATGSDGLQGRPFRELVQGGEWPSEADLRRLLVGTDPLGRVSTSRDVVFATPGGAVPVLLSLSPMRDQSGAVTGIVGVAKDMREKRRAEAERDVMQRQVVQAAKLASIGELAAGIAHEINNPLTVIKGNLDYFHDSFEQRGERELLTIVRQQEVAIERIVAIVNGLRSYARRDDAEAVPLDLHHLVDQSLAMIQQLFGKQGVTIETKLEASAPFVSGNAGRFQQVLMNLLTNAKDALEGRESGHIVVRTENAPGRVVVKVIDDGCGIPEDIKARLFEPFFTTKEAGKGTGLGLGIVKSLVEEMRGRIEVESTVGKGSTFTIHFPQLDARQTMESSPIEKDETRSIPAIVGFTGRALIVDDEDGIRELLTRYLTGFGFQVDSASDGVEALAKMGGAHYDLLVTDLKMPRMTGDALIGEGRKQGRLGGTKIVAVTGSAGMGGDFQRLEQLAASVDGVVRKPFSKSEIYLVLKEVL